MQEIFRTRDVVVYFKGKTITTDIDTSMRTGGWSGGQGVKWTDNPSYDEFTVTYSDGPFGGFLLWGSNESSDQFVSFLQNQPAYGFGVVCTGGWIVSTLNYERYTYASRQAGPLVPLVYSEGDRLFFSLRGLFTKEDEWSLSGDPRAPNEFLVGVVFQAPTMKNVAVGDPPFLGVHTSL